MQSDDVTRSIVDPGATASRAASSPPVAVSADPDRIGEIELLRKLGEGGMGTVWLGRDALLGRDVAVKLLLHATTDPEDPGFRAFLDGARVAASIRSPRLTQIFRAGLHDGRPYLVMEYSPGRSLTRLIADRERFTRAAAFAAMSEVCAAVAELHEHGIVHGDIKPANILVESDGRVVVTDFGLTLSLPREHVGAARAHGGTPRYMAPELFEGKATYQSDVYALGIMFFEILSGSPPFDGSIAAVRELHKSAPLPWERIKPPVGEMLREVIERATHREARLRSKSGRHLLDAIRRALPDEGTWSAGRADLVLAARSPSDASSAVSAGTSRGSSYYESLESLARDRATGRGPGHIGEQVPAALPAPALNDQEASVPESVPCADCGYDLRGVSRRGVCPECGLSVETSMDRSRLIFADRTWLTSVRRGMFEVQIAPVAMLLVPGFVVFGAAFVPMDGLGSAALSIDVAIAGFIFAMVIWRSTPRDPQTRADQAAPLVDPRARRWVRVLSLFAFLPLAIDTMLGFRGASPVLSILNWLFPLATTVCWLLWLEHLLVRGWSRPVPGAATSDPAHRASQMRRRLLRGPVVCAAVIAAPSLTIVYSMLKGRSERILEDVGWLVIWLMVACTASVLVCGWAGASVVRREIRQALKTGPRAAGR